MILTLRPALTAALQAYALELEADSSREVSEMLCGPRYDGREFEVTFPARRVPGSIEVAPHPDSSVRVVRRYVPVPL